MSRRSRNTKWKIEVSDVVCRTRTPCAVEQRLKTRSISPAVLRYSDCGGDETRVATSMGCDPCVVVRSKQGRDQLRKEGRGGTKEC